VNLRLDIRCRNRTTILTAIALLCMGIGVACEPSRNAKVTDDKAAAAAKDTSAKRYNLTGRVVSIDKSTHSINVDGDEIPGFMAAMTMPYQVKDAGALEKLSPGDQIKAEIVMGNDGAYLENIVLAQKAPSPTPAK
jgi:protein SCO1